MEHTNVEFDSGSIAWMNISSALVLMMTIPGLALFYGGLVRLQNVLSIVMQCFSIACLISVMWIAFGSSSPLPPREPAPAVRLPRSCARADSAARHRYSLCFAPGSPVIGDWRMFWLQGVGLNTRHSLAPHIPEPVFVMYPTPARSAPSPQRRAGVSIPPCSGSGAAPDMPAAPRQVRADVCHHHAGADFRVCPAPPRVPSPPRGGPPREQPAGVPPRGAQTARRQRGACPDPVLSSAAGLLRTACGSDRCWCLWRSGTCSCTARSRTPCGRPTDSSTPVLCPPPPRGSVVSTPRGLAIVGVLTAVVARSLSGDPRLCGRERGSHRGGHGRAHVVDRGREAAGLRSHLLLAAQHPPLRPRRLPPLGRLDGLQRRVRPNDLKRGYSRVNDRGKGREGGGR